MKNLFFSVTLLLLSLMSNAQLNWTELHGYRQTQRASEIPHPRERATYFTIDSTFYLTQGMVIVGSNDLHYPDMFAFNPSTLQWTQRSSPPTMVSEAYGFSINGKGYLLMGLDASGAPRNELFEYDPLIDQWTAKAAFPDTVKLRGFLFVINGKAYVGGGKSYYGAMLNSCWEYDPATDQWMQKNNMPGNGVVEPTTFSMINKGFLFGGFSLPFAPLNLSLCYDPVNDLWDTVASYPGPIPQSQFEYQDTGYVFGGNSLYRYEPVSDQWTSLPLPFYYPSLFAGQWIRNNQLYVYHGPWQVARFDISTRDFESLSAPDVDFYRPIGSGIALMDTVYFGRYHYSLSTDVWEVDDHLGGWPLFASDSLLYVVKAAGSFQAYNPLTQAWTPCDTLTGGYGEYAFWLNGYGYTNNHKFDPVTRTWTACAPFPGTAENNYTGFAVDGKGYILGGYNNMGSTDEFWEYDPVADAWTQRTPIPGARIQAIGGGLDGTIVAGYGINDAVGSEYWDFYRYDLVTDTWIPEPPLYHYNRAAAYCFYDNNRLLIGLGINYFTMGNTVPFIDLWSYNPMSTGLPSSTSTTRMPVYPNPASGWLIVDLPYGEGSPLEILDMTGKIRLRQTVPAGSHSARVSIHGLTPGMYLIRSGSGSGSTMTTFIVSE